MSTFDFEPLAGWIGTFALHSTLALAAACTICWCLHDRAPTFQERLLRLSVWAALVSATMQTIFIVRPDAPAPPAVSRAPVDGILMAAALSPVGEPGVAPEPLRLDRRSSAALVAIAGCSALVGLAWLLLVHGRQRRALALRRPEADPRVLSIASSVAHDLGMRRAPRQSCSDQVATPIAFGWLRPEVCLPDRVADLDEASLRAMLAHEIAHVRRGDPAWTAFFALMQALFPWQLLLVVACRRWARLVELQCDAVAAQHSSPTAVARCLITVAEWLRPGAGRTAIALGMAARPSSLRERVEAVLHPRRAARDRRLLQLASGGLSLWALTCGAPAVHCAPRVSDPGPIGEAPGEVRSAEPRDVPASVLAALEALTTEREALGADARRLQADLARWPLDPELEQLTSELDRRLSTLERLSVRLQARVGRHDHQTPLTR